MKRVLTFLLAAFLLLPSSFAEDEGELLWYAIELGKELDELAHDTAYMQQKTDDVAVLAFIRAFAEGDHDEPVQIIQVDLSDVLPDDDPFFEEFGITDAEVKRGWRIYTAFSLLHEINQFYGEAQEAASNVLQMDRSNIELTVADIGMYVLMYDDAAPVGVVCWQGAEGASFKAKALPDRNILDGFKLPLTVVYRRTEITNFHVDRGDSP